MVNAVLERLYREGEVVHRNGHRKKVCPPGLSATRGRYLFDLVRRVRPPLTLEVGFAYGISTLFIAEALRQNGIGRHLVMDPKEHTRFDGLGLRHLEEAGLASLVTFYDEPAEFCLPRLVQEGVQVDFAFDDSDHLFDHVLAEFLFLARLVRRDGLVLFDDANHPGVGRALDFIATNRPDFAEVKDEPVGALRRLVRKPLPAPPKLMRLFRKVQDDDPRDWQHFVPF